jgi:hypothetical protein
MFKFVLEVVDCFPEVFYFAVFVASTADVLNGIAKVEVQPLITDEIPDLYGSSSVVVGTDLV